MNRMVPYRHVIRDVLRNGQVGTVLREWRKCSDCGKVQMRVRWPDASFSWVCEQTLNPAKKAVRHIPGLRALLNALELTVAGTAVAVRRRELKEGVRDRDLSKTLVACESCVKRGGPWLRKQDGGPNGLQKWLAGGGAHFRTGCMGHVTRLAA